ncbi:hypothetical protein BV25DRAFT_1564705 [Artomyces pyxidatus]|uniref:Uncharacterized protein n=1 Tax=Artomyces pyxidatus TaxID=48021 RepID=A0ACB8SK29_9AGAM|nr:hypothetical protein BV25DRAFT_1564705 [Artomyces pyxidatus]
MSSDASTSATLEWFLPPALAPDSPPLSLDLSDLLPSTESVKTAYAPRIRALAVRNGVPVPGSMPALRTLFFRCDPGSPFELPQSVRHFGLHPRDGVEGRLPLPHITAALSTGRPRLFSVNQHLSDDNRRALKEVCDKEGVAFTVLAVTDWPAFIVSHCSELS